MASGQTNCLQVRPQKPRGLNVQQTFSDVSRLEGTQNKIVSFSEETTRSFDDEGHKTTADADTDSDADAAATFSLVRLFLSER